MRKVNEYLLAIIVITLLIPAQFSCVNKSQASQSKKYLSIEGFYIGSYVFDKDISDAIREPQYFSFIIKPGGDLTVESIANGQEYYARGKWKLEGSTIHCNYRYTNSVTGEQLEQMATADWSETGKFSDGRWHNTYTPGMKGSFFMLRVN